jgi:hypothetical protein
LVFISLSVYHPSSQTSSPLHPNITNINNCNINNNNNKMLLKPAALFFAAQAALASPLDIQNRQTSNCPKVHVFGSRETTAPAGYGTAGVVVNLVLGAFSGSTGEAISYPACGGQSSCGGQSYGNSAKAGTAAVAKAVNAFNTKCPTTQLVLVGYSQVRADFVILIIHLFLLRRCEDTREQSGRFCLSVLFLTIIYRAVRSQKMLSAVEGIAISG